MNYTTLSPALRISDGVLHSDEAYKYDAFDADSLYSAILSAQNGLNSLLCIEIDKKYNRLLNNVNVNPNKVTDILHERIKIDVENLRLKNGEILRALDVLAMFTTDLAPLRVNGIEIYHEGKCVAAFIRDNKHLREATSKILYVNVWVLLHLARILR